MFKSLIIIFFFCLSLQAEPINEIGKVQTKDGKHLFVVKKEDKNIIYLLPDEPRKLFVKTKGGDESGLKEHEGTILIRWTLKGEYEQSSDGKPNIITQVDLMEPKGPGFLRTEEMTVEGTLEVNQNSSGLLSFNVITDDKITYFLPAKKFTPKPSDYTAEKAASLKDKKVKIKAKVQVRKESPHRVATLIEFSPK